VLSISTANSQQEGRTFLFTYPANTFPLGNNIKTEPLISQLVEHESDRETSKSDDYEITVTESTELYNGTLKNSSEPYEATMEYEGKSYELTTVTEDYEKNNEMEFVEENTMASDYVLNKDKYFVNNDVENGLLEEFSSIDRGQLKVERNEKSLVNQFPSYHPGLSHPKRLQDHRDGIAHHLGAHDHSDAHAHHHGVHGTHDLDRRVNGLVTKSSILTDLHAATVDDSGRKCVNKVMMREETEYDEVLTCDHSYDKRCHTSYVTKYEPHQEEECDEKFRKVCTIEYEQKAVHEMVEVCITPFIKNCDIEGKKVCSTVYESECFTRQIVHNVTDDIANCKTVEERKCKEVNEGYKTVEKCDIWPKEECVLEQKAVLKYTPHTSCQKVPREMCYNKDCGVKEGPVQCQDKVKTVVIDNPIEQCDLEPIRTCKHVTKLVPKLASAQDCVDVPKEICAMSKVNPRKVKKPSIQKWCYTPEQNDMGPACECSNGDDDCTQEGYICKDCTCRPGCRTTSDCKDGNFCNHEGKCQVPSGKVLLQSFSIETESCIGCSEQSEGVQLKLIGEKRPGFLNGVPCSTSARIPLNHLGEDDFQSGGVSFFDGHSEEERTMMGSCFGAALNAEVMGGTLTWTGVGQWTPSSICVDWQHRTNFVYKCSLTQDVNNENVWLMDTCQEDVNRVECK